MKSKYVVILSLLALIIGYIFGCILPNSFFVFRTVNVELTNVEFVKIVISVISCCITFSAVVVALFKDDIREFYKRPKLRFETIDKTTFEDTVTVNGTLEAQKYTTRIGVKNCGNTSAMSVEIFLENLQFKEQNSQIVEPFETSGVPLNWNGLETKTINIPPGSKKIVNLIEIFSPKITSTPDSEKVDENAKILIGKEETSSQYSKGIWSATFTLHSVNHKMINQKIEVEWKGEWKSRLSEFEKVYKFELK